MTRGQVNCHSNEACANHGKEMIIFVASVFFNRVVEQSVHVARKFLRELSFDK